MGTNYYWLRNPCPTCGLSKEELHIGKSSGGWCFSLHIIPEQGIISLEDWKRIWEENIGCIKDEYDRTISVKEMLQIITERKWKPREDVPIGYGSWKEFHDSNYSEFGPNNLIRFKIDGKHCIGHGDNGKGTWDLIQSQLPTVETVGLQNQTTILRLGG